MILFFAIISFVFALAFCLVRDYKLWLNRKVNDHNKSAVVKGLLLVPPIVLFTLASDAQLVWAILISWLLCCSWFWILFDGCYNVARGYKVFFTGSEDGKEDAKTDNFLQSIPLWLHVFIKVFLIAASTFVYIKLL